MHYKNNDPELVLDFEIMKGSTKDLNWLLKDSPKKLEEDMLERWKKSEIAKWKAVYGLDEEPEFEDERDEEDTE